MRNTPFSTALIVACAVTAILSGMADAQDAPFKPGDLVTVVPAQAELKVGTDVVARLSKGQQLIVKGVKGKWVGCVVEVANRPKTGWILARDLRKAAAAPAASLPVTARPPDRAAKVLDGDWTVTRVEIGNSPFKLEPDNPLVLSFHEDQPSRGGAFSCRADGTMATLRGILELPESGTFRVDASARPRTFDINARGGVQIQGILEFRDDATLVVCFGQGQRPKEFSAGVFFGGDVPTMPKLVTLRRRDARPAAKPAAPSPGFASLRKVEGNFSTAIVRSEVEGGKSGIVAYRGSRLWFEMAEQGAGQPSKAKVYLDQPGSLLFVAAGGVRGGAWKRDPEPLRSATGMTALGTLTAKDRLFFASPENTAEPQDLPEGRVYRVSEQGQPQPTAEGAYSVWVSFDDERPIHEAPAAGGPVLRKLARGEKARLLLAGKDPAGWHRVRAGGPPVEIDGWVRGGNWSEVLFMNATAPPSSRAEGSGGLKRWIMGDWQSIDDPGHSIRFARPDGKSYRTEDGVEFTFRPPFTPDGVMQSKSERGLKVAAFHFISADTIEYQDLLGRVTRMKLADRDDDLVVTEGDGESAAFRRRPAATDAGRGSPADPEAPRGWPSFSGGLSGRNEVRITNPNGFAVTAGLRCGKKGKDFSIPARSTRSSYVPDGRYDIYFRYSNDDQGIYQGDSFTLAGNGVEIQIVKRTDGNYGIRRVQ